MGHENYTQLPEGLTKGEIEFFSHKTFADENPKGGAAINASTQYLASHKEDREQNRREYLNARARREAQKERDTQQLLAFADTDEPPEPDHSTNTNSTFTNENVSESGPEPEPKSIGEELAERLDEDAIVHAQRLEENDGVRIHDTPLPIRLNPYNETGCDHTERRQIETVTFKSRSGARINIPMETWCPASRNSVPLARTCMTNNKSNQLRSQSNSREQLLSETEGYRLLQTYGIQGRMW